LVHVALTLDKQTTQHYHCVVIPPHIDIDSPWDVVPPGIHDASLKEVETRFATNPLRQALFDGLVRGCNALRAAGCSTVYLDGSYITMKESPGDFDACWDPAGVDTAKLDPVLLDFQAKRAQQKKKFGGEFFPSSNLADGSNTFIDFFQLDRFTGKKKGIIRIRLQ